MTFDERIDMLLISIEIETARIRTAAGKRNLVSIRESLGTIRTICTEIGHEVAEKEVMREWPNGG